MLRTSLALFALATLASAQCPDWSAAYYPPGADARVWGVAYHDNGAGEQLYVAGEFQRIGDQQVSGVARWNGTGFEAVGSGLGSVLKLESIDSGTGPKLYARHGPAYSLVRLDGSSWVAMPAGSGFGDLIAFDDGSGPALYATGDGQNVLRYDGVNWVAVGVGSFDRHVRSLGVYDDGSGPALYAGGNFRRWNGVNCASIARWNGSAWLQVGDGLGVNYGTQVESMCVFGTGPAARLIAAGEFTTSGAQTINNVAAWDGTTWSPLGTGVTAPQAGASGRVVRAVANVVLGGAPRLIAVGDFNQAGGSTALHAAQWDGTNWAAIGTGVDGGQEGCCTNTGVFAVAAPSTGELLAIGGVFTRAGTHGARCIARWDGQDWHGFVAGESLAGDVVASTVHDDGSGSRIYVGGRLEAAGNDAARLVARFDGSTWERVGPYALDSGWALALASIDLGGGRELYVGGDFNAIGGAPIAKLARWDGSQWNPVPGFAGSDASAIHALLADVSGLYAGGTFTQIGGVPALGLARFDGTTWSAVGSGLPGVLSLSFFDAGSGRQLYAGGTFPGRIARFDGTTWITLPQPPTGNGGRVQDLQPYFDGTSERLFVGGVFTAVGGVTTYNIASWSGTSWTTYGIGTSGFSGSALHAFRVFDDGLGAGPKLFVGGYFASIQNQTGFSVISWDGSNWESAAVNGGVDQTVYALEALQDGTGTSLFAFGNFEATNLSPAWGTARYGRSGAPGCAAVTGEVDCDGSGGGGACPCGNFGAAGRGCDNSSSTGGAGLIALGQANVRADDVTLRVDGLPNMTMCLFFQGTTSIAGGAGVAFGDGVRCVGGAQIRLAIRQASGGVAQFGSLVPGDPSVSGAGAIGAAATRSYQVWYRDAQAFCTASTFNLSNGLRVRWAY